LGFPTGWSFTMHQALFLAPLPGRKVEDFCVGSFRTHIFYFVIVLLYFIYFTCIAIYQKLKKLESLVVVLLICF
jgi:hypothetical protein